MSSSLDESRSDRFLASSSGTSNFWVEDMCICWLVYLFLRLSWFWAFGWPPLACLILAQFIVYAVSAVSWTPVSFHLSWMSAVVAWGLASSSCASNLWIEWSCVACLGLSSSSLDCLGSVPSACGCFGSVPCLSCLCGVVDSCRLTANLDECHSCMWACLHHPALVTFGFSDIVPVGLSISSLVGLGSGSSVSAVRRSSLAALSLWWCWLLTVQIYPGC